jgi:hypothetical protein
MLVRIEVITMHCWDERRLSAFWTAALGSELGAEIRRQERLGARRVRYVENDPGESHWIMADPEGNEFCCVRPPWEPRPPRPEE